MYKVAIRCGESELAAESLQIISSATTKDPTLLYACCLDAQQSGNKLQTIAALQLVLEKYGYNAPSAIHLPSLIRTTIQLMLSLLNDSRSSTASDGMEVSLEKLCKAFEGGKITHGSLWNISEAHHSCVLHAKIARLRYCLGHT
jgi:hypothetical protein